MSEISTHLHIKKKICSNEAESVIFIEGIGANLKGWNLFFDYFQKDYTIYAFDHPCSGHSILKDRHSQISSRNFTATLEKVIESAKNNVHLVGYSLGGYLIFNHLINNPGLRSKIKTVTIAGSFSHISQKLIGGLTLTKNRHLKFDSRECYLSSLPYLYDSESLKDQSFVNYLKNRCVHDLDFISSENFVRQLDVCISTPEWTNIPKTDRLLETPALIMYADDDQIVSPCESLALAKYFEKHKIVAFERGGHGFKDVHREKFCEEILTFIAQISPRSSSSCS